MKNADWNTAVAAATAGKRIRRDGWRDKWLIFSKGRWWIIPLADVYSQADGVPYVVTSSDFGDSEFKARDWTTDPIPKADPASGVALSNLYLIDDSDGTYWQPFVHQGILNLRSIAKPT